MVCVKKTYIKTKGTYTRYEKYGALAYIINKQNQNKTKITNKKRASLFWLAEKNKPCPPNETIQEWINKGYLKKTKTPDISQKKNNSDAVDFKKEFSGKPKNFTSAPLLATLGITSQCNYQCLHCGNNSGKKQKKELSLKEIKSLIAEMAKLKIFKLALTGGEPLLRKDFFEILKFASAKIPRVTVTSNASLINKSVSIKLKKCGAAALKISIDGTEKCHDKIRSKKGTYKKAINAIKHLKKQNIETRIQSTLMKNNAEEIIKLMPILAALEIKTHTIVPVSPIGRATQNLALSPEEYRNFILRAAKKIEKMREKTCFQMRPVFGLNLKNDLEILSAKYKCEALKTSIEITPEGNVIPCSFFPLILGNIRKNTLQQIWISEAAQKARKIFDEKKLKGKCRNCGFKKSCGGGCLANSYAVSKKFHFGDIYCWRQ